MGVDNEGLATAARGRCNTNSGDDTTLFPGCHIYRRGSQIFRSSKVARKWPKLSKNSKNTAIYIGNGTYKINADSDKKWNNPYEIPNQIDITRTYKNVQGNAFFSAKWFVNKNQNVTQLLMENQYKYPALPHAVPNSKMIVIDSPMLNSVEKETANSCFSIKYPLNSKVRYIMVYRANKHSKIDVNNPSQIIDKINLTAKSDTILVNIPTKNGEENSTCALTFVDFYGNESTPTILN